MKSEIVKYDNKLNELHFNKFTTTDYDLFMAVCAKMRDRGTDTAQFTYDEIKEITGYKPTSDVRFIADLHRMSIKQMSVCVDEKTSTGFRISGIFDQMEADNGVITITTKKSAVKLINNLVNCFTIFSLADFVNLKSKYSKSLFRVLSQFRQTGIVNLPVEKLKSVLDVPEAYETRQITRDVVNVAVAELRPLFPGLAVEVKRGTGRGRKISGYCFTFTPIKTNLEQERQETTTTNQPTTTPVKNGSSAAAGRKRKVNPHGFHNSPGRGFEAYRDKVNRIVSQ